MSFNKKSKFKGVTYAKNTDSWDAVLQVGVEEITITNFKGINGEKEAAKAYDRLCLQYLGTSPNGFFKKL